MEQTGWEMRPAGWILLALLAVVLVYVVGRTFRNRPDTNPIAVFFFLIGLLFAVRLETGTAWAPPRRAEACSPIRLSGTS